MRQTDYLKQTEATGSTKTEYSKPTVVKWGVGYFLKPSGKLNTYWLQHALHSLLIGRGK